MSPQGNSLRMNILREMAYIMKKRSTCVRFASLCAILAVVAKLDLELVQIDVKDAFLHGEINEMRFMG